MDAEKYAADSRNLIIKLEDFREEVSALNHLMEIDEIWKKNEEHQIRIKRVEQESKVHIDELNELEQRDSKMCESITSNTHEIKSEIIGVVFGDYYKGSKQGFDPAQPGDIWKFKKDVDGEQFYVKLKIQWV